MCAPSQPALRAPTLEAKIIFNDKLEVTSQVNGIRDPCFLLSFGSPSLSQSLNLYYRWDSRS